MLLQLLDHVLNIVTIQHFHHIIHTDYICFYIYYKRMYITSQFLLFRALNEEFIERNLKTLR